MKKFLLSGLALVTALVLVSAGCDTGEAKTQAASSGDNVLALMTWNVQNLFDGKDNGFEYDEFKASAGWSDEKYRGRINIIADSIKKIKPLPDIIMMQEIESLTVLEDLAGALQGNYRWSHFAVNPGAALGLGLISSLPIIDAMAHTITVNGETTPRPVLEARIQAGDDQGNEHEFVVFVCHWKSKLGGDEATESARRASARGILRRIRELHEQEPDTGIIVAGDLNENHDEFFRQGSSAVCALLPDDPFCAGLTGATGQKDFIVISRNQPPSAVHFPHGTVTLYSPWLSELDNGSYYYRHNWETIDHFLISGHFFDNTGLEYEKTVNAVYEPFVNIYGTPVAYNMRTGAGLSDHVPLLLMLGIK